MLLLIYVDDMLLACKHIGEIQELKKILQTKFDMKNLGAARKMLGMEIERYRQVKK